MIYRRALGTEVSNALSDSGHKNLGLGSSKYSELIRVASQCPEMALYNRRYQWGTPEPDDLNHPVLGELMCPLPTGSEPSAKHSSVRTRVNMKNVYIFIRKCPTLIHFK